MKLNFSSSGFFVLRTPLLPFKELLGCAGPSKVDKQRGDLVSVEETGSYAEGAFHRRIKSFLERPEVQEGLFLGSPDLFESLPLWLECPESENAQRIERALYRYFSRMTSRATPFGLFAGCSVGAIGAGTSLKLGGREGYRRRSRLDMEYLCALAEKVTADPRIQREIVFRPNTTLYGTAGRYHYVEGRFDGNKRSYHLVELNKTPYLEATLRRAREGIRARELAVALVHDDNEISMEEANEYVSELIGAQVLVSYLKPLLTGAEPVEEMTGRLASLYETGEIATLLGAVQESIAKIDTSGLGVAPSAYKEIANKLKGFPLEFKMSRLFQVDMMKPSSLAMLGERIATEMLKGVEILHRMVQPEDENALSRFKAKFSERYQEREVPLVEVLDEDAGIGFDRPNAPGAQAAPLLAGIPFATPVAEPKTRWGKREAFLFAKLENLRAKGDIELRLDQQDLLVMDCDGQKPLPDAFSIVASIAAASSEAIAKGRYEIYLHGASGPSGARLLGRFCHADAALQKAVEGHLRAEESLHPDAIFAEIVHLPEGRIGNILFRPCLRSHEIPFLGRSGMPMEKQIPISDLMVSVRQGRVFLRSRRMNKEIVPRLTSAHNYGLATNLMLYRFLCEIQTENCTGWVGWDWGILDQSAFLPRVSCGRLVFCRARWRLDKRMIDSLAMKQGAERFEAFRAWSEANKVPRFVALAEQDNELLIDRDSAWAIETLVEYIKNRSDARLVEMFPGPDELCCEGPEGRFTHELVIPFVKSPDSKPNAASLGKTTTAIRGTDIAIQRSFPPGSEWLYAKLYASPSIADHLLQDMVAPLAGEILASGAVDRWHFIRYSDPAWHLRVRFHGSPAPLTNEVLPRLREMTAQSMADGLIWRLQLDTYDREIERYGGEEGIELSEALFHHDSEASIAILAKLSGDEGAEARWKLALVGIDRMLADMGMDLSVKHRLLSNLRDAFAREFKTGGSFKKNVSARFRTERAFLDGLVDFETAPQTSLETGVKILEKRSEAFRPVMRELARRARDGRLTTSLDDLARSFVHMHVNRMLRSAHRAQEAVMYHFLAQIYESRLARLNGGKAQKAPQRGVL